MNDIITLGYNQDNIESLQAYIEQLKNEMEIMEYEKKLAIGKLIFSWLSVAIGVVGFGLSNKMSMVEKPVTNDHLINYPNSTKQAPLSDIGVEIPVREHIRNLHEGWTASNAKRAEAADIGITLMPGQTYVSPHFRKSNNKFGGYHANL